MDKTCRTYNGYDINGLGQLKDGRGNICPVTIILPTLAMMAKEQTDNGKHPYSQLTYVDKFLKLLDKKIYEAKEILLERFEYICSQSPASAKFMYENNVMAGICSRRRYSVSIKTWYFGYWAVGLGRSPANSC